MKTLALATLVVALATTAIHAEVLNFEGLGLSNGAAIPQTYGDIPNLDLSYRGFNPNTGGTLGDVNFQGTSYGDLLNIANSATAGAGIEIAFLPAPGFQVTVTSFDLGGFPTTNQPDITIHLIDFGSMINPVVNQTVTVLGAGPAHSHFDVNVTTSSLLWIHISPGNAVGIDNVVYSVSAVPEPTSATALLAGTLLSLRRRR